MLTQKNFTLQGQTPKPILTDVFYNPTHSPKPIVIFCHGYKGYKDWGAWNLVAKQFAEKGFFFIKFNFSHNGGTPENPIDFPDLNAFAEDNFSKQLQDLESVINWIITTKEFVREANVDNINLIGHSRGGGIALIKAAENNHITKVATWAGVSNFESRFPKGEELEDWREKGVRYVENSRTKQQMPHHFQFYEDFKAHKERFNIRKAVRHLHIPQLIIHTLDDTTVNIEEAKLLRKWNPKSKFFTIEKGGHTFGTKQPWQSKHLSAALLEIVKKTMAFFKA